MKRLFYWILLLTLLLVPTVSNAQWSGNVDASGGFGTMKALRNLAGGATPLHFYGKTGIDFSYTSPDFIWKSSLTAHYEPNQKDHLKGESLGWGDDRTINGLLTLSAEKPLVMRFRSDALWLRPQGRTFSTWIQYQVNYQDIYDINNQFDQAMNMGVYGTEQYLRKHVIGTGLGFSRPLGRTSRELAGSLSYGHIINHQKNLYFTVDMWDEDDGWADIIRTTPRSDSDELKAVLHYKDSVLTGKVNLVLDPGLRVTGSHSLHKYSGATAYGLVTDDDYNWRDSTALRERFNFSTLDIQPYLAFSLSGDNFLLAADYALMLYSHKLTDVNHKQGMQLHRPYAVGNGAFSWQIAAGHILSITNTLYVRHPTYLQVCWYDRSSGYIDRLYRGNPQLKSNVIRAYGFVYQFRHKRFNASTTVQYVRSRNEIVQTWFREEIDDRQYQVFTWVNGADSRQLGISQSLGWKGKVLTASLSADYHRAWRRLRDSDGEAMRADDWKLSGKVSANLGKGWVVSTDATYQSAVSSFFSLFSDYCTLNAHVSKTFKKVTLYLAGHDLADKPVIIRTESADGSEVNHERSYDNRRLIILGCKWSF